ASRPTCPAWKSSSATAPRIRVHPRPKSTFPPPKLTSNQQPEPYWRHQNTQEVRMNLLQKGILFLIAAAALYGQSAAINGQIEGTITDPAGAVVPNAKVEATNDDTGYKRSGTTDN